MFIKVNSVNYFVVIDGKNIAEIYYEIIARMNKFSFTLSEKRYILSQIKEQIRHEISN